MPISHVRPSREHETRPLTTKETRDRHCPKENEEEHSPFSWSMAHLAVEFAHERAEVFRVRGDSECSEIGLCCTDLRENTVTSAWRPTRMASRNILDFGSLPAQPRRECLREDAFGRYRNATGRRFRTSVPGVSICRAEHWRNLAAQNGQPRWPACDNWSEIAVGKDSRSILRSTSRGRHGGERSRDPCSLPSLPPSHPS